MNFIRLFFSLVIGSAILYGGFMLSLETVVPTCQSWYRMQNWLPSSANLTYVAGSDSDTQANYTYVIDEVEYQGNRVYVAHFKDNIGSYHQDLFQKLNSSFKNEQPVTIWYNPENAAEAVIDRNMRWGLFALMSVFCSFFLLIGFGIILAGFRSAPYGQNLNKPSLAELRQRWRQSKNLYQGSFIDFVNQQDEESSASITQKNRNHGLTGKNLDAPWTLRKDWAVNKFRSNAKSTLVTTWIFAIIWNAITIPILLKLEKEIVKDNYLSLLGLFFPLVGLYLLVIAWNKAKDWLRLGVIYLELDPFPGSIGGHVGGSFLFSKAFEPSINYTVELECVHTYISGSGDNRSRKEVIKWKERGLAKNVRTGRGMRLLFRFDIPDNLPEADIEQKGNYHFWRLRLSSSGKKYTLNRQYNVPVFATHTKSKLIDHDLSAQAHQARNDSAQSLKNLINRGDFTDTPLSRSLRYENQGGRHHFYFPMLRNKMLTVIALVFAAGFNFAAFMMNQSLGGEGALGIGIAIFSLPFAVVGLIASVSFVYMFFNNLSVTLADRKLTAIRRLLFIPITKKILGFNDIRKIDIESNGSTGSGVNQIKHFKLKVSGPEQKKFTIAEDIDGEETALLLRKFIADRVGLSI